MATISLIAANTSPTVEVYRITDGANSYIIAQDGASTSSPTALSIQVDYTDVLERIASHLESIATSALYQATDVGIIKNQILEITTSLDTVASSINLLKDTSNTSSQHLETVAAHFEVERAMNVADLKEPDFYEENFDKFNTVKAEINNPTQF